MGAPAAICIELELPTDAVGLVELLQERGLDARVAASAEGVALEVRRGRRDVQEVRSLALRTLREWLGAESRRAASIRIGGRRYRVARRPPRPGGRARRRPA